MPRVRSELNPKRPKKFKRPSVKKSQKYLITQDNRLIYAKYGDITANEIKVFYYIISKLNPLNDKDFELCEMPTSEILGEVLDHESFENYTYIAKLCNSLLKRVFIDETRTIDPTTNKEIHEFVGMPMFQKLKYKQGEAIIKYQLNESLKPYLLGLKKNFTQIPLQRILPINSGYAIRIYQMLLSELKQNRNEVEMNLLYLQDVLCVPKSMYKWDNFKRNVLEPSLKEINATTDIVADYRPLKERQKIVKLEFQLCYKDLQKRKDQAKNKETQRIQTEIIEPLTELKNKTLAYPTDPLDENAIIALVYRGMHEVKEVKGKLQVVLTLEEANNPRKKQQLILTNANQIEKLKAMKERYEKNFFTQNASKVLKNKDGSGLAYAEAIKAKQETNKTTKNLFESLGKKFTQEDPPNQ
ncbi:replication initiation protein [Helicobacter pylori]|uniref:replication initiation protein n=1 Tax=Helicobacter pylori TaxID=210 RepID=UPI001ABBE274|nr:replication initiation protein [Helicobacter pylori]